MATREESSSIAWFVAGFALGVAGAVLLAPRSGKETREVLRSAAERGRELVDRTRRDVVDFGREHFDRNRNLADDAEGVPAGSEANPSDLAAGPEHGSPQST